ncbi:MAG: NADH-quinone oxidoreductase subunit M [Epsilonproteobacteria bacterium]|nr:MAG: NADH-quinone oxidoreductase subunit M [Campylobacterota bacterium]
MEYILTIIIFFPALAAVMGFVVDKNSIRAYGILVVVVEFLISVYMWYLFDNSDAGIQFAEFIPIVSQYGISYNIGIDGISLFLVLMTTFMTMIAVIGLTEKKDIKNLILTVLFLEMTMIGVFVALDAILFYLFWELSLVPMLYIVGAWGGKLRIYASVKFFLYTFTGSLLMLVGMLYLAYVYFQFTGNWSFNLMDWDMLIVPYHLQLWLFVAFFAGFAIKVPMVPFHTWLPYAHGQAPTIGSTILAAVLLKMGTYGFVRFSLPLFPDASVAFMIPMAILALIAIIYTAMVAYAQEDIKQVVAYSSVSHMGVIILGIFAINTEGIGGALFLMISHGVVSGALFMLVGVLYDKRGTKMMSEFGGLAKTMPIFAVIFGVMLMASVGLPLTIGFVGEFLSLLGFFVVSPTITIIAGLTIVLGAVYMLVLYKKTFFGPITNPINEKLQDIKGRELFALAPLVMIVIFLGVYPKPILEPVNNTVKQLVQKMYIKASEPTTKSKIAKYNTIGEKIQ